MPRTRRELGFEPGDVVATFIGTFGQWHGVDVLAQAIRRMVLERRASCLTHCGCAFC